MDVKCEISSNDETNSVPAAGKEPETLARPVKSETEQGPVHGESKAQQCKAPKQSTEARLAELRVAYDLLASAVHTFAAKARKYEDRIKRDLQRAVVQEALMALRYTNVLESEGRMPEHASVLDRDEHRAGFRRVRDTVTIEQPMSAQSSKASLSEHSGSHRNDGNSVNTLMTKKSGLEQGTKRTRAITEIVDLTEDEEVIDLTGDDDATPLPSKRQRMQVRSDRTQADGRTNGKQPGPTVLAPTLERVADLAPVVMAQELSQCLPDGAPIPSQAGFANGIHRGHPELELILWYSSLESAHENDPKTEEKAFHRMMACDHHYHKVMKDETLVRVTRKFSSASLRAAIGCQLLNIRRFSQWVPTPTLYEIIPAAEPIRFFAQVNLRLPAPVDLGAHEWLLRLIGRALRHWLTFLWKSSTSEKHSRDSVVEVYLAESCEGPNFSCHAVTGTWLTDIEVQGRAAMVSFATYLQWYIQSNEGTCGPYSLDALIDAGRQKNEWSLINTSVENLKIILTAASAAASMGRLLDTSVYTSNSQLRMLGSPLYKPGFGPVRSLFPTRSVVTNDELQVTMLSESKKRAWLREGRSCDEIIAYMVIPGELWINKWDRILTPAVKLTRMIWFDMNRNWVRFVELGKHNPVNKESSFARSDRETSIGWETCPGGAKTASSACCNEESMEALFGAQLAYSAPTDLNTSVDAAAQVVSEELACQDDALYHCVDPDEFIIDAKRQQKLASAFGEGDTCFCPQCETLAKPKGLCNSVFTRTDGIGSPSAVICQAPGHYTKVIKCWNGSCLKSTYIVRVDSRSGMECHNEIIHRENLPSGYLTLKGADMAQGIEIPLNKKLIVIDAPFGSGKTRTAAEYIRTQYPAPASVIVLTFRCDLAMSLARMLGISCYLDDEWSKDCEVQKRSVVCINSLRKLGVRDFYPDVLLLDDASLLTSHMVGRTFSEQQATECIKILHMLMRRTKKQILVMQRDISDSGLQWWRTLASCSQDEVWSIKVVGSSPLKRALVLSAPCLGKRGLNSPKNLQQLLYYIGAVYLDHLHDSDEAGHPKKKIFLPVFSKDICITVSSFLSRVAKFYSKSREDDNVPAESRQMRIKALISGSDDAWVAAFQEKPDTLADDIDVLVCTPALHAGINVGKRFKTLIGIIQNASLLTHEQEFRMTNRLMMASEDLTPWSLLYIDKGYTGSYFVERDCEFSNDDPMPCDFLRMLKVMVQNARDNTACRHLQMWKEEYDNNATPWEEFGPECLQEVQDSVLQLIAPKVYEAWISIQSENTLSSILGQATEKSMVDATVVWAKQVAEQPGRVRLTHLYAVPGLDASNPRQEKQYGEITLHDPSGMIPQLKNSLLFRHYDIPWMQHPGTKALLRWVSNFDEYEETTDITPVLLAFATSSDPAKFKTQLGVIEHRQSARVLAHVIHMCAVSKTRSRFDPWKDYHVNTELNDRSRGPGYEPYQQLKTSHRAEFTRKENVFVRDAAPFVFELLVEELGVLYRDDKHGNGWVLCTESRVPPSEDTATDWVEKYIEPHQGRTRAFNVLAKHGFESTSVTYGSLSRSMLIQKLLKAVGLIVHMNYNSVVLDAFRFFMSCVGIIPWLNVTELFFANAFSDRKILDTLRVYVVTCATASLMGPWHGIKNRGMMNTFIVHLLDPPSKTLPKGSKKIQISSRAMTTMLVDEHVRAPYEPYVLSLLSESQAAVHYSGNVQELRKLVCMLPRFVANEHMFVKQTHGGAMTIWGIYPPHLVSDAGQSPRCRGGIYSGTGRADSTNNEFTTPSSESPLFLSETEVPGQAEPASSQVEPLCIDMHGMCPVPLSDGTPSLVVYYKTTREGKPYKAAKPVLAKRLDPTVRRKSDIPTISELRAAIDETESRRWM